MEASVNSVCKIVVEAVIFAPSKRKRFGKNQHIAKKKGWILVSARAICDMVKYKRIEMDGEVFQINTENTEGGKDRPLFVIEGYLNTGEISELRRLRDSGWIFNRKGLESYGLSLPD